MKADAAAECLIGARLSGASIDCLPSSCRPASIEEVYEIHDALRSRLGLSGWKVGKGGGKSGLVYAPIFEGDAYTSRVALPRSKFPQQLVEIELAFRIVKDPGDLDDPSDRAILDHVEPFILFEVISSRFASFLQVSPLELIADSNASGAVVIGDPVKIGYGIASPDLRIETAIDGHCLQSFSLNMDDPIRRALWLIAELRRAGRGIAAGHFITTGALVAPALVMHRAIARSSEGSAVELRFT